MSDKLAGHQLAFTTIASWLHGMVRVLQAFAISFPSDSSECQAGVSQQQCQYRVQYDHPLAASRL